MTPDRSFQQLVQQYLDGTATPDGMQRLNQQLRTVPEARQWFIELLNVDSALAAALIDEPADDVASVAVVATVSSGPRVQSRRGLLTAATPALIAACLTLILAVGLLLPGRQPVCPRRQCRRRFGNGEQRNPSRRLDHHRRPARSNC